MIIYIFSKRQKLWNYSLKAMETRAVIARIWGWGKYVYKRMERRRLWVNKTVLFLHYGGGQMCLYMLHLKIHRIVTPPKKVISLYDYLKYIK